MLPVHFLFTFGFMSVCLSVCLKKIKTLKPKFLKILKLDEMIWYILRLILFSTQHIYIHFATHLYNSRIKLLFD